MSLSRSIFVGVIAAGAVVAGAGPAVAEQAEPWETRIGDLYGAMALSRSTGAVSYAVNYTSLAAAGQHGALSLHVQRGLSLRRPLCGEFSGMSVAES